MYFSEYTDALTLPFVYNAVSESGSGAYTTFAR